MTVEPGRVGLETAESEPVDLLDSSQAGSAAVRGSVLRSGGYVAGLGLSLISAPLLTRHLGTVGFGEYVAVISLVTIVAGLTEGGLNSIAVREYVARRGPERASVMRDLIGIRLALSVVAGLVAVGLAAAFGYRHTLVLGTEVAVAGQLLQVFETLLGTSLQGEMRFGWITALELVRQTVTVALIVVLVLAGAGLLPFFAIPVAAGIATLSLTLRVTRRLIPLRPAFHFARWWPLLRDTLPFAAAIAVSVLYFRVGVIAMSLIASSVQTGYFAASFRVIEVLVGVPSLIAGTAFPILARAAAQNDDERLHYAAGRLVEGTMVLGTFLSLLLVLGARPVIDVLGGAAFSGSIPVLRIQGLALMATCVAVASGFVLLALHRHRAILLANGVSLVVSVVLSVALIPTMRAQGAAIAVVFAEFSLAATLVVTLVRLRPALLRAFVLRPLVILTMGAAACGVALIPGLGPVVKTALGAFAFIGLLMISGYMPPEIRELWGNLRRDRHT
ncbi:MAG: oligosaccharide flippase family protein [Solirubrobacterales bacterium]|nr:oligosaccharide flippase family protein [Solirubrobacterales bacterium]